MADRAGERRPTRRRRCSKLRKESHFDIELERKGLPFDLQIDLVD